MTDPDWFPVTRLRLADPQVEPAATEPMGSKRKYWLTIPDRQRPWLFKYSRTSHGQVVGEHWSEKLGSEFARLLGLPAAAVELATLDEEWGSLSESFTDGDSPLIHGNDLLAGHDQSYQRGSSGREPQHRIDRIFSALAWATPEGERRQEILRQLAGMLVLDAMILNTDRHHENWGILMGTPEGTQTNIRLAPSFDHASSLARNESAEQCAAWLADRSLDRVAWYAQRAPGAIWLSEETHRGPSPLALVIALWSQDRPLFAPWLTRVRAITPAQIAGLVHRVPEGIILPAQRDFVIALVQYTTSTLTNLP